MIQHLATGRSPSWSLGRSFHAGPMSLGEESLSSGNFLPTVPFDRAFLKLDYVADIHALAVVIELADIDLSAVNMMPPRQGMHIPQLGYL